MPKINQKSIKTYKTYPTLRTFKYVNSEVYHFVMYVGTNLKEINNKKVMSGNFGHSLKTRVIREAEQRAKDYYKDITSKINSGEIKNGQNIKFNFDKDIVDRYFHYREKDYQVNDRSMSNLRKEKSQYHNYCSEFFTDIDYKDDIVMEIAIMDLVNYLKQTRKDTTITKYMNIISQVCKFGQRKGLIIALPNIPTFSRINEEVPPYFPKDIRAIRNQILEEYKKTEDEFFMVLYDYVGFLSALKINRAGQNSLNVKKFQFNETKDKEFILPIVKCTLHNTKNKKRIADVIEPWFVDQYYPRLMRCDSDDYIFMSKEKNRSKLYERIRKNFVRISSELGLYMFNGKRRPMYSIRHMNALKLYEDLKDINLVAQALNTSPDIVKSNYLNYSDEWARNRFKILGYDKKKLPQSSMKSKNKVQDKS